ncbi:alpha-N-acetyl-neuraminyl-2,3-beta-galactosyl-1,3-N-acetyl-galactosaminide alpha-2,6-sialyltransferase-like [Glandiceps talaboti]
MTATSALLKPFITLVCMGVCFQILMVFYTMESPDHPRIKPRHVTEKEVRGPTYHIHKIDPMNIDLREKYDSRRSLIDAAKPHFMSRREILSYHREILEVPPEGLTTSDFYDQISEDDDDMNMHCNTCSLVSNSGQLLYSNMGDEIDLAQCVFRLNTAPTYGYELDVGKRTTVRIVSHRSISDLAGNATALISQNKFLQHIIFHGPQYKFSSGKTPSELQYLTEKYNNVEFHKLSKTAETLADKEWETHTGKSRISTGTEYSTGFYALMLMRNLCENIVVYGMIPETYCSDNTINKVPYTYFDNPSLPECLVYRYHENVESGGHRLLSERRVFKEWTQQYNLTFLQPAW